MSSISVTVLSYVNIGGAGDTINVTASSPIGLTINNNQQVFVSGATSNRTTVEATNSFIRDNGNDLLLGGKGNGTLVGDFGTNTLTKDGNGDLFVFNGATTSSLVSDVITNFNASESDKIGIVPKDLVFTGFDSTHDGTLVQHQNSFLGGVNLFNF